MNIWFMLITLVFVVVSVAMILIILVQRPQGGGLVGAFGGAGGGGSTESVFGGRIGDALTWATVVAFVVYLTVAITLNLAESRPEATAAEPAAATETQPQVPAIPEGGSISEEDLRRAMEEITRQREAEGTLPSPGTGQ